MVVVRKVRDPPLMHLLSGASMMGAFFILTDPVSSAVSNRGRFIYGVLIGMLVYVIRAWGNYPDAVAFAVLLANFAAPLSITTPYRAPMVTLIGAEQLKRVRADLCKP